MKSFGIAIKNTLDPKGGGGLSETIMVLAIIISITVLTIYNKEIPPALIIIVSAIGGLITGYRVGGNKPKEGDKE